MNRMRRMIMTTALALSVSMSCLTACSSGPAAENEAGSTPDTQAADPDYVSMFTDRDSNTTWSEAGTVTLSFEGDSIALSGDDGVTIRDRTAVISQEGSYRLTGKSSDAQVIVDTPDDEKVQLILDGVDLTCSNSACILIRNADKVFVTMAEGSVNRLSDAGKPYVQSDPDLNIEGVVYSRSDIVFNGNGTLSIFAGFNDGIVSRDDLKFTSGTYEVKASGRGICGKDSLRIKNGSFTVEAEGDALRTSNHEKAGKGYIYIEDGSFTLTAGDDALHGETSLIIRGGTIYADAKGSGIDSDGSILIEGGTIVVDGPVRERNGALDYVTEAVINGGVLMAAGSSGVAEPFSDRSSQYSILYVFETPVSGGTKTVLLDASGNTVCSMTPAKSYSSILLSTPEIREGIYQLKTGEDETEIRVSSVSTRAGRQSSK